MRPRPLLVAVALLLPAPALAQAAPADQPLSDPELARQTGKFLLPGGVELALSITSDTVVNGQAVLRTVLTIDRGQQLQVYGRDGSEGAPYAATPSAGASAGVNVVVDRTSGLQTVVPVRGPAAGGTAVNAPVQDAATLGLKLLPLAPGGPAVATADGTVSLAAVRGGSQVTLAGDQYGVAHLVGSSVATALVNSGNDRTFDNVTDVAVDLRGALPMQVGSAAARVENLALDATRGMMR